MRSLTILLLIIIIWGSALGTFIYFFQYRKGSTHSRLVSYKIALSETLKKRPLVGFGYKPQEIVENASSPIKSIGSHSTLIGIYTKLGLPGLTTYLIFIVLTVYITFTKFLTYIPSASKTLKYKINMGTFTLGVGVFTFLAWQIFEDIDAPLHAPVLFGMLLSEITYYHE